MVAAFDYCLHGTGGAAPSIDTAMHALVDAAHVDHLHPDSGIAFATAKDGAKLTAKAFGGKVLWVPWRRPGFQLGLDIAALKEKNPDAVGCILGGHGITAWGATSAEAEKNSRWIIATAAAYIAKNGQKNPFGARGREERAARSRPSAARRRPRSPRRSAASRRTTARWSATSPTTRRVLEFLASAEAPRLAALGTSCPDHFLRTKVKPMLLDLPAGASVEDSIARLKELHEKYRADYTKYYEKHAVLADSRRPMRGADPLIVLVPGVGMFSYGANKQTARVAGEFYLNAINVMRGAEAISTYTPISDAREVPHRVLGARGGEAAADAEAEVPRDARRAGDRGRIRNRQGDRDPARRRRRVRRHRRPRPGEGAGRRGRARRHRRRDRRGRERHRRRRDRPHGAGCGARLRRHRHRRQQRRRLALEAAARDHREGLGLPARHHGEGLVPGLEGRPRRCSSSRAWAAT